MRSSPISYVSSVREMIPANMTMFYVHKILHEVFHACKSEKSVKSIEEIAPAHEWSTLVTTLDQLCKLNESVAGDDQKLLVTFDMDIYIAEALTQMHTTNL